MTSNRQTALLPGALVQGPRDGGVPALASIRFDDFAYLLTGG